MFNFCFKLLSLIFNPSGVLSLKTTVTSIWLWSALQPIREWAPSLKV